MLVPKQCTVERLLTDDLIAVSGEAVSFVALFDQYHAPITNYLYRMTGNRDVADDLAQDTFIKAYRALKRGDLDGDTDVNLNPRAWLYRIATNTALSWRRRRRLIAWLPFASGTDAEERAGTPEPSEEPAFPESIGERELIQTALQRIGTANASILLLRHHQHLSLVETACALSISTNTAKVRLYRARKAFVAEYRTLTNEPDTPSRSSSSSRKTIVGENQR